MTTHTTHTYTCIICPISCQIDVIEDNQEIIAIQGHLCPRGEKYATEEFMNPVRILTTTIGVEDGVLPVVPVRSEHPIPKALVRAGVNALRNLRVRAPIQCGDVLWRNIANTGVNIIASRSIARQ